MADPNVEHFEKLIWMPLLHLASQCKFTGSAKPAKRGSNFLHKIDSKLSMVIILYLLYSSVLCFLVFSSKNSQFLKSMPLTPTWNTSKTWLSKLLVHWKDLKKWSKKENQLVIQHIFHMRDIINESTCVFFCAKGPGMEDRLANRSAELQVHRAASSIDWETLPL